MSDNLPDDHKTDEEVPSTQGDPVPTEANDTQENQEEHKEPIIKEKLIIHHITYHGLESDGPVRCWLRNAEELVDLGKPDEEKWENPTIIEIAETTTEVTLIIKQDTHESQELSSVTIPLPSPSIVPGLLSFDLNPNGTIGLHMHRSSSPPPNAEEMRLYKQLVNAQNQLKQMIVEAEKSNKERQEQIHSAEKRLQEALEHVTGKEKLLEERTAQLEKSIQERTEQLDLKEKQLHDRELFVQEQTPIIQNRETVVSQREVEAGARERELGIKESALEGKISLIDSKEHLLISRENVIAVHEKLLDGREKIIQDKETEMAQKESKLSERVKEQEILDKKYAETEAKLKEKETKLNEYELTLKDRDEKLKIAEKELDKKKTELESKEKELQEKSNKLNKEAEDWKKANESLTAREETVAKEVAESKKRISDAEQKEKTFTEREKEISRLELGLKAKETLIQPTQNILDERESKLTAATNALKRRELEIDEYHERGSKMDAFANEFAMVWFIEAGNVMKASKQQSQREKETDSKLELIKDWEARLSDRERVLEAKEASLIPREAYLGPREQELSTRERMVKIREEQMERTLFDIERRERDMEKRRKELTVILEREKEIDKSWPESRAGAEYLAKCMLPENKKKSPYHCKNGISLFHPSEYAIQLQRKKEILVDLEQRVAALAKSFDGVIQEAGSKMEAGASMPFDAGQKQAIEHVLARETELKGEMVLLRRLKSSCPMGQKTKWTLEGRSEPLRLEVVERWWKETVTELIDKRLLGMLVERREYFEGVLRVLNIEEPPESPLRSSIIGHKDLRKLAGSRPNLSSPLFSPSFSSVITPASPQEDTLSVPKRRPLSAGASLTLDY